MESIKIGLVTEKREFLSISLFLDADIDENSEHGQFLVS